MIQKLKLIVLSLCSLLLFAAPLAVSGVAYADPPPAPVSQKDINKNLCSGSAVNFSTDPNKQTDCDKTAGSGDSATNLAKGIINVISLVVGAAAVIMLIFGGFRYVTSGGKQESVTSAKNTIIYAIIGLVIVALAQVVVQFVLNKTTSSL